MPLEHCRVFACIGLYSTSSFSRKTRLLCLLPINGGCFVEAVLPYASLMTNTKQNGALKTAKLMFFSLLSFATN